MRTSIGNSITVGHVGWSPDYEATPPVIGKPDAPPAASPWIESDKIHQYPELHSTSTDTVKLLARVEGIDEPQFARYVGACEEWFVFGSPYNWNVTHFAIIYPPNTNETLRRQTNR
jgi:hypothetical protein